MDLEVVDIAKDGRVQDRKTGRGPEEEEEEMRALVAAEAPVEAAAALETMFPLYLIDARTSICEREEAGAVVVVVAPKTTIQDLRMRITTTAAARATTDAVAAAAEEVEVEAAKTTAIAGETETETEIVTGIATGTETEIETETGIEIGEGTGIGIAIDGTEAEIDLETATAIAETANGAVDTAMKMSVEKAPIVEEEQREEVVVVVEVVVLVVLEVDRATEDLPRAEAAMMRRRINQMSSIKRQPTPSWSGIFPFISTNTR